MVILCIIYVKRDGIVKNAAASTTPCNAQIRKICEKWKQLQVTFFCRYVGKLESKKLSNL